MKTQTAVEYLMDKLFDPTFDKEKQIDWFQQAKEMEKKQIVDAHGNKEKKSGGVTNYTYILTGEKYYNETFNNNKN